jgi:hypothetical protein
MPFSGPPAVFPNKYDDDARRLERVEAQVDACHWCWRVVFVLGWAALAAWGALVWAGWPASGLILIPLGIGMIIGAGVQLGTELLMNVDRLITGTFVYGVASLCITVAYLGLMGTLGLTLGERLPVPVAVTFTLLVALAFQPVKRRLERLIDQLIGARNPPGCSGRSRSTGRARCTARPPTT